MIKHKYQVSGVDCYNGCIFTSSLCIADDMIDVIKIYRDSGLSPHKIERLEQVHANSRIGIIPGTMRYSMVVYD